MSVKFFREHLRSKRKHWERQNCLTVSFFDLKHLTRNSAIADKPRDAFRGQSRSPNMVQFPYVRYGFLLVHYSNIVPKIFDFKNVTLKPG